MSTSKSSAASATPKTRAKHACRVCNSRRVKCNVMEVQPCDNCVAAGAQCEIIPSRRGRYPRRSRRNQESLGGNESTGSSQLLLSPHSTNDGQTSAAPVTSSSSYSSSAVTGPAPSVTETASSQSQDLTDPQLFQTLAHDDPGSSPSPAPGFFFGESNFITLLPGASTDAQGQTTRSSHGPTGSIDRRQRLVFPVPDTPQSQGTPDPSGVSSATMRYLRDQGALTLPDLQTCVPALQAYFKWFHPCFPIVDREEVIRRLAAMDISRTLLQAMLFVGATYCEDETIRDMGFGDRLEAKRTLYGKARMLFHADWEKDRITLIQSLFLISFWRGGPEDIRDVRYWLGVVLTLAESHGLHRSEKFMSKNPRLSRLKRRIWWSIYVRERQAAASLGLPSRIRDEDCDIEPLTVADWGSETENTTSPLFDAVKPEQITYVIKMAEIAKLLGRVIDVQFVPGQRPATADHIEALDSSLESWRCSIPEDMQYPSDEGGASIWASLLHLAYNHIRILIHRNSFQRDGGDNKSNRVVVNAACRISRTAEDMSAQGTLRYGQMHLITSLFASLCIHAIGIRRNIGMSQRIAEHRAQLCLLCLKEIQKYWRVNNNVLDLFLHYLDSSIAKRLHGGVGGEQADTTTIATTATSGATTTSASEARSAAHGGPNVGSAGTTNRPKLRSDHVSSQEGVFTDPASSTAAAVAAPPPSHPGPGAGEVSTDPMGIFEDHYLNLVNASWEGDDALGDLGLFLRGDDLVGL